MYSALVVILIIDALLLSVVVLLQAGQGGGLASLGGGGGTELVMGGRQAVTLLTTLTKWLGGAFMVLALLLSVVASNRSGSLTDVQRELQQSAPTPGTSTPVAPLITPGDSN